VLTRDLKSLLGKLNHYSSSCLESAAKYCVENGHYEVTLEHWFLQLLANKDSDISLLLSHHGIDVIKMSQEILTKTQQFKTTNIAKPVISQDIFNLISDAVLVSFIDYGLSYIRSFILLEVVLKRYRYHNLLFPDVLLRKINEHSLQQSLNILKDSTEEKEKNTREKASNSRPSINPYCIDLTEKAKKLELDPVYGRDNEIEKVISVLARRKKNNPILVGDPGVGKTALIEGLALRIVAQDVPNFLIDTVIYVLDLALLEAGSSLRGEFEKRLKDLVTHIQKDERNIILFIDEAHLLIGGGNQPGGQDAANILKPALARGELTTIAATTWKEYKKYFEKDAALARRFQLINVKETSYNKTVGILQKLKENYESSHGVIIDNEAIIAAVSLSTKYIMSRRQPDNAIDLLDISAAKVKISMSSKPLAIRDIESKIEFINNNLDYFLGNEKQEKLEQVKSLKKQLQHSTQDWHSKDRSSAIVDKNHIAETVSSLTGVPLGKILQDSVANIINIAENLKKYIKGQDSAIDNISKHLKSAVAELKEECKPLGVFLLVGPSGVGKTETALSVADVMFGRREDVININMSEFQESHSVSRLIGSPPGYVGFGEGGLLTEAVRKYPYSVLLLDEVEKASLDVVNLFYQVFDKGELTDGEGQKVSFRNTVIFLTSNLASNIIQEQANNVDMRIRNVLKSHFKPALLSRMIVIPYMPLGLDDLKKILIEKLALLQQRVSSTHGIKLVLEESLIDVFSLKCLETERGARQIDHIISTEILPVLSDKILSYMLNSTDMSELILSIEKGVMICEERT
jgi:type VI secretion system protein VasG